MRACSAARVVRYPYLERNMLGPTHTGCGLTHALTVQHLGADRFGTQAALLGGMPKSRRRCQRDRSTTTDVVTQLECAIKNPHAALIGALIGGLVPWFGRTLAHEAVPAAWSSDHHNRSGSGRKTGLHVSVVVERPRQRAAEQTLEAGR